MGKKKLIKALEPFVSKEMRRHSSGYPDQTIIGLEISGQNGYRLALTMKELRKLWKEFDRACGKSDPVVEKEVACPHGLIADRLFVCKCCHRYYAWNDPIPELCLACEEH